MTTQGSSAVILQDHRTNVAQPPSAVLDQVTLPSRARAAGEVRVHNLYQQVIAASGDLMYATSQLPLPSSPIGEPIPGASIGRVVESRIDELLRGTLVQHMAGWREESIVALGEVALVANDRCPCSAILLNQ